MNPPHGGLIEQQLRLANPPAPFEIQIVTRRLPIIPLPHVYTDASDSEPAPMTGPFHQGVNRDRRDLSDQILMRRIAIYTQLSLRHVKNDDERILLKDADFKLTGHDLASIVPRGRIYSPY